MKNFKLRIKSVDMNGYLGREHHPAKTDEGLVVTPIQMEAWFGGQHAMNDVPYEDVPVRLARAEKDGIDAEQDDVLWTVWTCVTEDGRLLELIDHEVEMVA
jgi:hypothetical protein